MPPPRARVHAHRGIRVGEHRHSRGFLAAFVHVTRMCSYFLHAISYPYPVTRSPRSHRPRVVPAAPSLGDREGSDQHRGRARASGVPRRLAAAEISRLAGGCVSLRRVQRASQRARRLRRRRARVPHQGARAGSRGAARARLCLRRRVAQAVPLCVARLAVLEPPALLPLVPRRARAHGAGGEDAAGGARAGATSRAADAPRAAVSLPQRAAPRR